MRVVTWPMIALDALVHRDLPGLVVPDEKTQTAVGGLTHRACSEPIGAAWIAGDAPAGERPDSPGSRPPL
jgi:hypothetical protein